jgi:signal peptidase II
MAVNAARWIGVAAAIGALALDQLHKNWALFIFDIAARQPVHITAFFDMILAWNRGISYSLFPADSDRARYFLLALTLAATVFLAAWLWRAKNGLTGLALGLLVGGALGNALDRALYGAVADFFLFHIGRFSWYVFNLADVAIVAGVGLLLYESIAGHTTTKLPAGDRSL